MRALRELLRIIVQTLNRWLMHAMYRLSVRGSLNIPAGQGALLVCNHVSYLDACIILAALKRHITFLIDRPIYSLPVVKQIVSASGAIPIEAGSRRSEIEAALDQAARLIAAGELVGIFPEGGITRTGEMQKFRKGIERIMRDREEQIIPLYLDGMWGSIFSYQGGKFFWKWPRAIFSPVRIFVGSPLPGDSSVSEVQQAVEKLRSDIEFA